MATTRGRFGECALLFRHPVSSGLTVLSKQDLVARRRYKTQQPSFGVHQLEIIGNVVKKTQSRTGMMHPHDQFRTIELS